MLGRTKRRNLGPFYKTFSSASIIGVGWVRRKVEGAHRLLLGAALGCETGAEGPLPAGT